MASKRQESQMFWVVLKMEKVMHPVMESSATLDPVHDAHLIDLFNSDTEDEDFDGF